MRSFTREQTNSTSAYVLVDPGVPTPLIDERIPLPVGESVCFVDTPLYLITCAVLQRGQVEHVDHSGTCVCGTLFHKSLCCIQTHTKQWYTCIYQ